MRFYAILRHYCALRRWSERFCLLSKCDCRVHWQVSHECSEAILTWQLLRGLHSYHAQAWKLLWNRWWRLILSNQNNALSFAPCRYWLTWQCNWKRFHRIRATFLRVRMFGNEAPTRRFSSLVRVRRALLSPVCLFALFALWSIRSQLQKLSVKKEGSANCWKMIITSYSIIHFFARHRAACPFSFLAVACLRSSTSLNDSDTDGEVDGEGSESSDSLPTLSTLLESFSIFARMNFATTHTNRDDVRRRLLKASMNVKHFVHFWMLRSIISFNILRWDIFVRTFSTKK